MPVLVKGAPGDVSGDSFPFGEAFLSIRTSAANRAYDYRFASGLHRYKGQARPRSTNRTVSTDSRRCFALRGFVEWRPEVPSMLCELTSYAPCGVTVCKLGFTETPLRSKHPKILSRWGITAGGGAIVVRL